jgi:hypothetical protein
MTTENGTTPTAKHIVEGPKIEVDLYDLHKKNLAQAVEVLSESFENMKERYPNTFDLSFEILEGYDGVEMHIVSKRCETSVEQSKRILRETASAERKALREQKKLVKAQLLIDENHKNAITKAKDERALFELLKVKYGEDAG